MGKITEQEKSEHYDIFDLLFRDIEYAGYHWTIVGLDGDIAYLLIDDELPEVEFGEGAIGYADSYIREYINTVLLQELERNGAKPVPTYMKDIGVADRICLATLKGYRKLPTKVREYPNQWWLRTITWEEDDPWSDYIHMEPWIINRYGEFDFTPRHVEDALVRPAIRVRIKDLQSPAAY